MESEKSRHEQLAVGKISVKHFSVAIFIVLRSWIIIAYCYLPIAYFS